VQLKRRAQVPSALHLARRNPHERASEREGGGSERSALDLARGNPHEERQRNIEQYERGKKESGDKRR
jgi:hypothetical protein